MGHRAGNDGSACESVEDGAREAKALGHRAGKDTNACDADEIGTREMAELKQNVTVTRITDDSGTAVSDREPASASAPWTGLTGMARDNCILHTLSNSKGVWTKKDLHCLLASSAILKADIRGTVIPTLLHLSKSALTHHKTIVVRILRRIYLLCEDHLDPIIKGVFGILCAGPGDARQLHRRCRGAITTMLAAQPFKAKVQLAQSINDYLDSMPPDEIKGGVSAVTTMIKKWQDACEAANIHAIPAEEWRDILARIDPPNNDENGDSNCASWVDEAPLRWPC